MGMNEIFGRGIGLESSGLVKKVGPDVKHLNVGPDVKHLKVGDRVLCCTDGAFSTTSSTSELLCAKMPHSLRFEEAATIPVVYATAIACLIDLACLSKDHSVLIHSACGGVGITAIQIAKMVGAEIFCTVSSQEKVDFLMQTFEIPQNHIFSSRDTSFLSDVLRETGKKGVDVVLNSLSGELLHSSWKCVSAFGTMVDISNRDLIGNGTLAMKPFGNNQNSLLSRAVLFYEQGYINPISPVKYFEATHVEDALRYMQKGSHIGKIVIPFPKDPKVLEVTTHPRTLVLRPDVSYLSIGGVGGLGRSIASWMVERGAKHLIIMSRSAGSLTTSGCSVQTFSGSVSNLSDVKRVVSSAAKPIAGVLQASMVIDGAVLKEMSFEQWQNGLLPKIQGTWNLHEAILAQKEPLDIFLFSSVCGMQGQWGHANYASGNTFLDAFVQFRHSLGFPASVLDIGAMEDVGYLSQNTSVLDKYNATSYHTLHELDLHDSLQLMIDRSNPLQHSRPQLTIGIRSPLPLSAPANHIQWKEDPRMTVYRNLESLGAQPSESTSKDEDLKRLLRGASKDPTLLDLPDSITLLAKETGSNLLGIDSLIIIELRNWFRQDFGVDFSVLELLNSNNIPHLG
ncbi:KR domain-containing protein [Usnea florida]